MAQASKHRAASRPEHARANYASSYCTAAGGLDAETFRGLHLAGKLFLLTSFFIELEGRDSGIDPFPELGPTDGRECVSFVFRCL